MINTRLNRIDIYGGSNLGHFVCRKPTHSVRVFHAHPHYLPRKNSLVINSFINRVISPIESALRGGVRCYEPIE